MGVTTILDIVGSAIVGGLIFLMLLRTQAANTENLYVNGSDLITQMNLVEVSSLLEYDFDKIGYCEDWTKMPAPTESILYADATSIKFLTDVDRDSNLDSIWYYLGDASELLKTPNPNDKMLYRVVNDEQPIGANLGVTDFHLRYFDVLGDTLESPVEYCSEIASLELNLTVENTQGYDNKYLNSFWKQYKLTAKNLRNR
jgi:hypothetical protein